MEIDEQQGEPVRQLSKAQRRVLGVLLEKAFTTPEGYPLTLKSTTAGCNQKSNRDPVTNYTEDAVLQALDELRELGLVAVIHTESGRTERYRHLMRKRYSFTEPQLAILTELWLRGQQQLGELRSRASRMVAIDSLEQLREELSALSTQGYVQSTGSLDRRGAEVDHAFYPAAEGHRLQATKILDEDSAALVASPAVQSAAGSSTSPARHWESELRELRLQVDELQAQHQELRDELDQLKRSLGV